MLVGINDYNFFIFSQQILLILLFFTDEQAILIVFFEIEPSEIHLLVILGNYSFKHLELLLC